MSYCTVYGLFLAASLCPGRVDDAVSSEKWVARYYNLGGVASFKDETVEIYKRSGQKPLIGVDRVPPPSARKVLLQGYEVTDDDVIAVAKWSEVERLYVVDGKKITDKGVSAVAKLPNLTELVLGESAVTDKGIAALSGNKSLTSLHIINNANDNKIADLKLSDMPKLKTLILDCNGLKGVYLSSMPKLEDILSIPLTVTTAEIKDAPSIDDLSFANSQLSKLSLSNLPKLEKLNVRKTMLSKEAVEKLQADHPKVGIKK